jgi:hypothetical protein
MNKSDWIIQLGLLCVFCRYFRIRAIIGDVLFWYIFLQIPLYVSLYYFGVSIVAPVVLICFLFWCFFAEADISKMSHIRKQEPETEELFWESREW